MYILVEIWSLALDQNCIRLRPQPNTPTPRSTYCCVYNLQLEGALDTSQRDENWKHKDTRSDTP
eukprot:13346224-Heterocapsa_arctica.AAC.1